MISARCVPRTILAPVFLGSLAVCAALAATPTEIIVALPPRVQPAGLAKDLSPTATGIAGLDALNRTFGCSRMSRAFRVDFSRPDIARDLGLDRTYVLSFDGPGAVDELVDSYRASGQFEYVEPNSRIRPLSAAALYPNDYFFGWQWGLDNREKFDFHDRWTPKPDADIDAPEAWEVTQGDSSVVVAIIDSGCKTDHPELAGRIWQNPGEVPGNATDDDGNGYVDDILGWDFRYDDDTPEDSSGHGTGVSGVLAANGNNGVGHAGVDWQCKLMCLKVFGNDEDGTMVTYLAAAIKYAADNGADIANMSLGDDRGNQFLRNTVQYAAAAGLTMIAAAGNDNVEAIKFPAAYPDVIAVGATDPDDTRSKHFGADTSSAGSNYGPELDVVAPGNNIYLLSNVDDTLFTEGSGGTSLAAPMVTGIASLLKSLDATLTPDSIRAIITATADDEVGDPVEDAPGWDKYMGWGRVSAEQAVSYGAVRSHLSHRGQSVVPQVRFDGRRIVVSGDGAGTEVSLTTPGGRLVADLEPTASAAGGTAFGLPNSLSDGAYLVLLRGDDGTRVVRTVLQR